jgi:hypothetical protein
MTYVRCGVTGRSVLSHFNEVELERKIDRRLRERRHSYANQLSPQKKNGSLQTFNCVTLAHIRISPGPSNSPNSLRRLPAAAFSRFACGRCCTATIQHVRGRMIAQNTLHQWFLHMTRGMRTCTQHAAWCCRAHRGLPVEQSRRCPTPPAAPFDHSLCRVKYSHDKRAALTLTCSILPKRILENKCAKCDGISIGGSRFLNMHSTCETLTCDCINNDTYVADGGYLGFGLFADCPASWTNSGSGSSLALKNS